MKSRKARRPVSAAQGFRGRASHPRRTWFAKRLLDGDGLATELDRNICGARGDRVIDPRARQMRDDQMGDAQAFAAMQIEIDPVAEDSMDDAAAIPDADQSRPFCRRPAATPGKPQP